MQRFVKVCLDTPPPEELGKKTTFYFQKSCDSILQIMVMNLWKKENCFCILNVFAIANGQELLISYNDYFDQYQEG